MIEKGNSKLSPKEASQPAAEKTLDKPPKGDILSPKANNLPETTTKKEETIAKPEAKVEIQR
jgi:hypothetical protein